MCCVVRTHPSEFGPRRTCFNQAKERQGTHSSTHKKEAPTHTPHPLPPSSTHTPPRLALSNGGEERCLVAFVAPLPQPTPPMATEPEVPTTINDLPDDVLLTIFREVFVHEQCPEDLDPFDASERIFEARDVLTPPKGQHAVLRRVCR